MLKPIKHEVSVKSTLKRLASCLKENKASSDQSFSTFNFRKKQSILYSTNTIRYGYFWGTKLLEMCDHESCFYTREDTDPKCWHPHGYLFILHNIKIQGLCDGKGEIQKIKVLEVIQLRPKAFLLEALKSQKAKAFKNLKIKLFEFSHKIETTKNLSNERES